MRFLPTPFRRRSKPQSAYSYSKTLKKYAANTGNTITSKNIASAVGTTQSQSRPVYPTRVSSGQTVDPVWLNALVDDVQEIKGSLRLLGDLSSQQSLMDKVTALQERIELLEDDING